MSLRAVKTKYCHAEKTLFHLKFLRRYLKYNVSYTSVFLFLFFYGQNISKLLHYMKVTSKNKAMPVMVNF